MSNHVGRIAQRPHAVRCSHLLSLPRALHNTTTTHAQDQRIEQDAETRLRIADQRSLRDMHVQTNRLIEGVNKLSNSVSRVPTTINNRHIDRPYTLSQLQNRVTKEVPGLASIATESVHKVQAHLTDLRTEPYVDKKDGAAAMKEFEEEIKHLTTEEKREMLKDLGFKELAREVELKRTAEDLQKQLREMQGTHRPEVKQSEASSAGTRDESSVKTITYAPTVEKSPTTKSKDQPIAEGKQSTSASTAPNKQQDSTKKSLKELQESLDASIKKT